MTTVTRTDVAFPSGDTGCAGWLTLPEGPGPHPAMVLAHGFGMTAACGLEVVADRLAAAGIASLAFDYRRFGGSGGAPRQVLDIAMQRDDYRAALAHARGRDELDEQRLGLWGTSFSGGHVLAVAATEPGLRAVVAQVPAADGRAFLKGEGVGDPDAAPPSDPDGPSQLAWAWHGIGLFARAALDELRDRLGRSPLYVPIAGELGSHAVIAGPDAHETLSVFVPDVATFDNRVAARIVLDMVRDRPVLDARRITAPLLVVVAEWDRIAPPGAARAAAEEAPDGSVLQFPFQHMEFYQRPYLDAVLDAEIAWLLGRLGSPMQQSSDAAL